MKATTHYELMVILKPDLGEKGTREALNEIRSYITEQEGVITFEDIWEKREFAYPMKSYEEGYYAIFYFDMAPAGVLPIKKELLLMPALLRELLITLPAKMDVPTYIASMKKREEEAEEEFRKIGEERSKAKREKEQSKIAREESAKAKKAKEAEASEEAPAA